MEYKPVIGLEIHTELKTRTKMFCGCFNGVNEKRPNINVCPVCMGHPGTLPVANKEAVKMVLMVGGALNGQLADYSRFDRKNYFYPDLPKGYQISQYKHPLVSGGELMGVKITRIHLEEDTGRLVHSKTGGLVDYNRAGVPLMELVTEPDIKSGEDATEFAKELQLILRYLNVSDADMEKGQMRVEANISLRSTVDSRQLTALGTKVEIKNLNSFRAVKDAIDFEIKRQADVLDKGEKIIQETRGWNENKQITFSQREKEESHDYRYFPEPDIPAMQLSVASSQLLVMPELPNQKRERFKKEYGIKDEQIEILINDRNLAEYFENVCKKIEDKNVIQLAVNYLTTDLQNLIKSADLSIDKINILPENFAELMKILSKGEINSRGAKDVLKIMFEKGGDPSVIIEEAGLRQIEDKDLINKIANEIISENKTAVEDYKKGKESALKFLIGQGMKKTGGKINPELFAGLFRDLIK